MAEKEKVPYKKWVVVALVVFLFFTTFGIGPIGINLYQSSMAKEEVGSSYNDAALDFAAHSYTVNHYLENKQVDSHHFQSFSEDSSVSDNPVIMEAYTDITHYNGNYFLPFYKDYAVKYVGYINKEGLKGTNGIEGNFDAKVEGTIKIKVIGLCTLSNAKRIAEKAALDSFKDYVSGQMTRAMQK